MPNIWIAPGRKKMIGSAEWNRITHPSVVPAALKTTEVTTGKVTVYRIPRHLERLVPLKGKTKRRK